MANNIPASINYTNRDFYSLRDDLIARVQSRVNSEGNVRWSGTDPSDFGVALLETFAYIGDITNYYIDRTANEGFLATAVQRQSVLDLAKFFDYTPSGYRQATIPVTITNKDTTTDITLLSGTTFVTSVTVGDVTSSVYFTLDTDTSITASSSVSATLSHGYSYTEALGTSTGTANQMFNLSKTPVVYGTVAVTVNDGNSEVYWSEVSHLSDYGPTSSVYNTTFDSSDIVTVTLGDGISGAIPTSGSAISATYTVGGGLVGNLSLNSAFTVYSTPAGANTPNVTVISTGQGTGGEDSESTDSIRVNVPSSLRTLKRAVSLADYRDLALSVNGVGKAVAKATQPNSVVLYVGPTASDTSTDYYPGMNAANTEVTTSWTALQSEVTTYFTDKTQIGVNVSVVPPTYVPVYAEVQYNSNSLYTHDQIIAAIKYQIVGGYGYNYLDFGTTIYPEQIENNLMNLAGLTSVKVISLYRTGGSVARANLIPTNGDYFVFMDSSTLVYPVASLKTLAISSGSFSPTLKPQVFSYSVNGTATSTVTFTPSVYDTTCVIKVNGTVVASGAASSAISTPSAATTIVTITVTTADGLSSNTYTMSITRA
jgi:hypothetical protein